MKILLGITVSVLLGTGLGLLITHAPARIWLAILAMLIVWLVLWLLASGGRIDDNLNNRND